MNINNNISPQNRVWEIDFLRGIAFVLMVYFHFIYDLNSFLNIPISYTQGPNYYLGKLAAILFIIISGVSCQFNKHPIKRGLQITGLALFITLATQLADYLVPLYTHGASPETSINFGILHLLGISMLLSPLFKKCNAICLLIGGVIIILAGQFMATRVVHYDFLFPLGLVSEHFYSSDYYPIFPWLGLFLFGMALGMILYPQKISRFSFIMRNNIILWMGKHTLPLYLVHQPILLLVLFLIQTLFLK